jgi:hypothetical protein
MTVVNAGMSLQGNLADMTTLLVGMEEAGKVDLAIIPKIDDAMSNVTAVQNRITEDKGMELKANFLAYHIVRNINLTLEKMRSRFVAAKENHDNPIVAEDSLALIPVLAESFQVAESILNGKLTSVDEKKIVSSIMVLRESMSSTSMLMSGEEESKRVSEEGLAEEGKKLAIAVKDLYSEEQ